MPFAGPRCRSCSGCFMSSCASAAATRPPSCNRQRAPAMMTFATHSVLRGQKQLACGLCRLSYLTGGALDPGHFPGEVGESFHSLYFSAMKRPQIHQSADSGFDLELVFCIVNAGRAMEQ